MKTAEELVVAWVEARMRKAEYEASWCRTSRELDRRLDAIESEMHAFVRHMRHSK